MCKNDDKGCNCAPIVMGLIIGGILGLLLAPKKGKETRKDLKAWIDKAKGEADDLDLNDKMENFKGSIKTHANQLKQTIKEQKDKFFSSKKEE